jgi:hypothetical protein
MIVHGGQSVGMVIYVGKVKIRCNSLAKKVITPYFFSNLR